MGRLRRSIATPVLEQRFFSRVSNSDPAACWVWIGAKDPRGYGRFRVGPRVVPAHRWAFEFLRAPIEPPELTIDHECDNPWCVNPWHLDPVPLYVNIERKSQRGRWRSFAPERHQRGVPPPEWPAPAYRRLADEFADLVDAGTYRPGAQIDFGRVTQLERNVIHLLVQWGYIAQRGGGHFVADPQPGTG